jgi:hypothetical protein
MPETAAKMAALPSAAGARFSFLKMKPPGSDAPIVLVKWYAYAKWVLGRVAGRPRRVLTSPEGEVREQRATD